MERNLNLVATRVPLHHPRQKVFAALPSRGADFLVTQKMAELPLPSPSGPEGQKPAPPRLVPANRPGKPDAAAIFSMLREAVASGRFEIDMILGAIAGAGPTRPAATRAPGPSPRGGEG